MLYPEITTYIGILISRLFDFSEGKSEGEGSAFSITKKDNIAI